MPRRRPGTLLPLESEILRAMVELPKDSEGVHGFALARSVQGHSPRALTSYGTLYKALGRMQDSGLLSATWEDPDAAAAAGRPRRKFYLATAAGIAALEAADRRTPAPAPMVARPRMS